MGDPTIDPGVGDPGAVRSLARDREDEVDDLDLVVQRVSAAAGAVLPPLWEGQAQAAFAVAVEQALRDARTLRAGLAEHAEALRAYATGVERIKDDQERIERRREALRAEKDAAIHEEGIGLGAGPGQGLPFGTPVSAADERLRTADRELALLDEQWADLVEERRRVDRRCVADLGSTASLGALALLVSDGCGECPVPSVMLAVLSDLTSTDLTLLRERHPELLAMLAGADPQAVHDWWTSLDGDDPWTLSPRQALLVAALPRLLGSLDGLPPHARVAANAKNAEARLRELDGEAHLPGVDRAALDRERAYLRKAVGPDATVQLYLFEPHADRIVQMLGTFGAATRDVVTYVPGTGTALRDFYNDPATVQQIGAWSVGAGGEASTVAFVCKDGQFPPDVVAADTPLWAQARGDDLARMQEGLEMSYGRRPVTRTAIGHSWGLTTVTSSEVSGAHYDNVVSLAGAGMVQEWHASPSTTYTHYSYVDFLTLGQATGQVYDRKVPAYGHGFERAGWWTSPHDAQLAHPNELTPALLANHSLIAQDVPENSAVLKDLRERLF